MAPYGACKSYKAEFEEVQHSEGQISETIEETKERTDEGTKEGRRSAALRRTDK